MKRKSLSRLIIAVFLLVPFGLFISSLLLKKQHIAETHLQSGSMLPQAKELPSFTLTDMNEHPFNNQSLKDHWSLLFFGFTHCPAVCPTSLAELAHAQKLFAPGISIPQVVFISVDPEQDSHEVIKHYLHKFNAQFLGATGTPAQLEVITKALGIMYSKIATNHSYTLNHSDLILVINPQGEWTAVMTPPHRANQIANDLAIIQKNN